MRRNLLYGTVLTAVVAVCVSAACTKRHLRRDIDTSTEEDFDLRRYMGLWYEIARMDHRFERGMSHVKTIYTLMGDGSVRVRNEGVKGDRRQYRKIIGRAVMPDAERPRFLRVSFFPMIYSDYNILKIDDDYTCALVGGSSPDYLWILSRTPRISTEQYSEMRMEAARRGYDADRLMLVEQR